MNSAHPHVCGEHVVFHHIICDEYGSSPRVWGAPRAGTRLRVAGRLIPTCVGSTNALMHSPYVG